MRTSVLILSALAATVSAHGNITFPPARRPGPAMVAACGQEAVNSVLADATTPLEDVTNPLPQPGCKLDLCRGARFEDNQANVQKLSPGQTVTWTANIAVPHEGPANISVVKTATNTVLGAPLLSFATYADEKLPKLPANNTKFDITLPCNFSPTDCRQPGECVMQWFWFGTSAKQTYESCVDFVVA